VACEELPDRIGEEVVAVAGNHVSGAADASRSDGRGRCGLSGFMLGTMSTSTTARTVPGARSPASSIDVNPPNDAPTSTGRGGSRRNTSMTSPAKVATR
jgi:hypothetical protein